MELWKGAPRMSKKPLAGFFVLKSPITLEPFEGGPSEEEDIFTPSMFMERRNAEGTPIGLAIDLTTDASGGKRLYEASEWEDWDVKYVQLPCAPPLPIGEKSHSISTWFEAPPPEELCQKFISVVTDFWANDLNKRRYVAVHCVTGINVSGYMICRFLMQFGTLMRSLASFAEVRPPGIYSVEILEALFRASETTVPTPQAWKPPSAPAWHPIRQRALGKPAVPIFSEAGASDRGHRASLVDENIAKGRACGKGS